MPVAAGAAEVLADLGVAVVQMTKETRLTFRIQAELKKSLEAIAVKEARSVAQVCEVILQSGFAGHQKEGPKYLHRLIASQKPKGEWG